jgi:glycosyltransferase involved in cell wall biosynthesis
MKFSLLVPESSLQQNHGYGVATEGVRWSLTALGHDVSFNDPTAPVEIAFTQPNLWKWSSESSYKIGYIPWESTRFPAGWVEIMQTADEMWATSPWVQAVLEKHGLTNVRVYQHGIDAYSWGRVLRRQQGPIKFLHIGEPAPRKGGQETFDAFMEITDGNPAAGLLTIKAHGEQNIRGVQPDYIDPDGDLWINAEWEKPLNVSVITDEMSQHELARLMHDHDVLVYPSWGEGFGLIPLQAMVTGMPVICTAAWAPYRSLLLPDLRLNSRLVPSPWPDIHPGNMYQPNTEDLSDMMGLIATAGPGYDDLAVQAYAESFEVERFYDWITLTHNAFNHILEKFETI